MRFVLALALLALSGCNCSSPPVVPDGGDGGTPPIPDGGDGGTTNPDGGPDPRITICPGDSLPPLPSGICEATAGSAFLLITGDVLAPTGVLRGGQVLVDGDGAIVCAACDCTTENGATGATTIVCPSAVVSPGLINAHEHITFQAGPYTATAERYEHRNDWRRGKRGHTRLSSGGTARTENVRWDELRMVMGGETSVNGSGTSNGLVRNLDRAAQEGLNQAQVEYDTFPLGDSGGEQLASGCGYPSITLTADVAAEDAYTPHISEGIDAVSRNEFLCVRQNETDLIQPYTAIIHGIGLLPADIGEMALDGTKLIWSPRSNITLYGDTARVTEYDALGVRIALGTDWQISGSMNMLRELRCADDLNRDYFGGHFTDEELWLMATRNAAIVTATDDVIGSLAPGRVADIAIFDASVHADHRAVIEAGPTDVALVLRGGRVLFGEAGVVAALPEGAACDAVDVCGEARRACVMRELGVSYEALASLNADQYPLFFCAGDPDTEPTCTPSRDAMAPLPLPTVDGSNRYSGALTADDMDGDGLANASDNCPSVFNPIRPVDMGQQADADDDMVGDACDPCPLDANSTTCTPVNPNDADNDTIDDSIDNCVGVRNMDQADRDMDGRGDLCDPCPDDPNPGSAACPASIYDIKNGTVAVGSRVRIEAAVVTAVAGVGFFMQVSPDDAGYAGPDFSGLYVYSAGAPRFGDGTALAVGDTVDVEGQILDYNGQLQLSGPAITRSLVTQALPTPVVATPAELDMTTMRANQLEAALVRVESVSVTNAAPPATGGETGTLNEFEVGGALRVDDFLYLVTPFVTNGETFTSITGVMMFRRDRHKLLPRSGDDLVAGAPQLAAIEPAMSYAREGAPTGPTFPEPLTVRLTRATGTPTPVTITVMGGAGLTAMDVTIPANAASAPVPVTATAMGTYTVDATIGGAPQSAAVRVLGASEQPASFTLSPATATVRTNATQTFTVTLDIPAPAGGARITLADPTGGVVPAEVIVPADALSATFDYVAPDAPTTGTLTATLEGSGAMQTADLTIITGPPGTLIINEVDYDTPSTDAAEFVELHNPGTTPVSLANLELVLVNGSGSGSIYRRIDLSVAGTELAPGGYLVVCDPGVDVDPAALVLRIFTAGASEIQNGDPDGLAVYDSDTDAVLDALSYGGSITAITIGGAARNLVEGTATAVRDTGAAATSMSRLPNGSDTDNAMADWALGCATPGAANLMTCP